ncbi:FkbM family methyltransferase [Mycolicibacterium novocastrense]|uniref:FkbM family methyltransferase n=1 Tax=Mycolicibacterium novocastrense TaxID=59813 RepID=UPI0007483D8D|nr:FkbM family methyltransferase [Mycolicibacterium novocastrense]KUH68550.1 FkbM family methyltransferase [Mycolicibacterium novocastrense]KUH68951.1 FkbM family methyltransferase [Mycolicibacterium novocastrense]KUH69133.1 FkbM family methyltransferase [Mycolicibacterium novocastrense]
MRWVRRGPTAVKSMYEQWEVDHLQQLFKHFKVDCVFDVGANVGQYATMLREKVGYKGLVVSFEPDPSVAAELTKKAQRQPRWVVEELAISAEDGTAEFNVMKENTFSSLSAPRHDEVDLFTELNKVSKTVTVKTENLATTVDRLRGQFGFSRPFLKLDTQGYDTQIVSAAPEAVKTFVGLQSELAIKKLYADSVDFREAITIYEKCGFELSALVPNNAGHFPRLVEVDCIMVRADLL